MQTTPEYEAALRGLKNGTLTKAAGTAENKLAQAYHRMVIAGLAPKLRTKYLGRDYKGVGSVSKGGNTPRRPGRLGMNPPKNWGTGELSKRQKVG